MSGRKTQARSMTLRHLNHDDIEGASDKTKYMNFQDFLLNSPYAQLDPTKSSYKSKLLEDIYSARKKQLGSELAFTEYFTLRRIIPHNDVQEDKAESRESSKEEDIFVDKALKKSSRGKSKSNISKYQMDHMLKDQMKQHSLDHLDPTIKKYIEGMQSHVIKLEQEMRKLKREQAEVSNHNKKLLGQVNSFIGEQENFSKIRESYEKQIRKLMDSCKTSDESLRKIAEKLGMTTQQLAVTASKGIKKSPFAANQVTFKVNDASTKTPTASEKKLDKKFSTSRVSNF